MKKLIILVLALAAGYTASAQQKGKTNYMSISIYQQGVRLDYMIVTRTDSAQEAKDIDVKLGLADTKGFIAEQDGALMVLITPYYNRGWKLVSFAVDKSIFSGSDYSQTFIYYLKKEE